MVSGISGDVRAATPTHHSRHDPASGYVPDIPPPTPVGRCSGFRCLRRRQAPWIAVGTDTNIAKRKSVLQTKNEKNYDQEEVAFCNQEYEDVETKVINDQIPHCIEQNGAEEKRPSDTILKEEAPPITKDDEKISSDRRKGNDKLITWLSRCEKCRGRCEETVKRGAASDEREAFSGLSGGRYMCVRLDRRCWLEVEDTRHRYAKNLRRYHYEWIRLGRPTLNFWHWLDEENKDLTLATCSRDKLETENVRYCNSSDRRKYALRCDKNHILYSQLCASDTTASSANGQQETNNLKSNTVDTTKNNNFIASSSRWGRLNTGPKGWIFVLHDGTLYARFKSTHAGKERFHHSSFFGGECVDAAGVIVAKDGVLTRLLPHSGHYRPREAHLARLLCFFCFGLGLELNSVEVDVQRLLRVARAENSKKTDTPIYWSAAQTYAFLERKALFKACALHRAIIERNPSIPNNHSMSCDQFGNTSMHDKEIGLSNIENHQHTAPIPRAEAVMEHRQQSQQIEERLIAKNLLIKEQDSFEEIGDPIETSTLEENSSGSAHQFLNTVQLPETDNIKKEHMTPHTPPSNPIPISPPSTSPRRQVSHTIEPLETRASSFPDEAFLGAVDMHETSKTQGIAKSLAAGVLFQPQGRSPSARDLFAFGRTFTDDQRNDPCDGSSDSDDDLDDDVELDAQGGILEAAASSYREERPRRSRGGRRSTDRNTSAVPTSARTPYYENGILSYQDETLGIPRSGSASSSSTMFLDGGSSGPNSASPGAFFWSDFDPTRAPFRSPPKPSKRPTSHELSSSLLMPNFSESWTARVANEKNIVQEEKFFCTSTFGEAAPPSAQQDLPLDIAEQVNENAELYLRSFPLEDLPSDPASESDSPLEFLRKHTLRGIDFNTLMQTKKDHEPQNA